MKKMPIGVENFKKIIDDNFYYIDKTMWIKDIINEQLALYTRPRRFGKTLNMSMLYYFFSNKEKDNAYLFDHLKISCDKEIMKYQNQYPVIFMSLKDLKNNTFQKQLSMFGFLIQRTVSEHKELLESQYLDVIEHQMLMKYYENIADEMELQNSLVFLIQSMEKHYHKKVIILIDEYDVPLQSAYANGYYEDMVNFLRNVFSLSLKTNDALEKGILTGCLRISKESIFTGLNNFKVNSLFDIASSQCFGFTHKEVDLLLEDYHLEQYIDEVKEWYDGYLFGKIEIYNPWSTLMYVDRKLVDKSQGAISFWANTSSNDIVYKYIKEGDQQLHNEFELLMQGHFIKKRIKPELTYRDMDNINNIYSFLLLTGYLKIKKEIELNTYELIIPNREVYEIYKQIFMDYFIEYKATQKDQFVDALKKEEVIEAENILNRLLSKSISYYDNQESFYHGFLLGLLDNYHVESNRESGEGRLDIVIYPNNLRETVIVIECKHSIMQKDLIEDSQKGANQIKDKKYLEGILSKGYLKVVGYGIAFYKKQCYITKTKSLV